MSRVTVLTMLLAVAFSAAASDSYRFDRGLVAVGDTVAQLVARAGQPSRTVQLENKFGAAVGERWEYYQRDGKMVSFYVEDGKIYRIEEGV